MATALKLEDTASTELVIPSADLVVAEPARGDVVLFNRDAFDQFEAKLREDLKDFVPDISTVASRKLIASKAFEVTKVKTTLEKQAKALTEEWRTKTKAVNDGRNVIVDRLEALADEVRKPLTDWEEAEKARAEECDRIINAVVLAGVVTIDDTTETVRQRGTEVFQTTIDAEQFGERFAQATIAKERSIETLKAALARLTREEADRAELERLRAENEAREAKEVAEREARERAEQEAEQARLTEQRRADAERAEAERIASAEREAAERARREADEAAEAERQRVQREHDAALAAERAARETAEREAQAERERVAAAEAARAAEEQRIAGETAKREADQKHRTKVKTEAKQALITCGADEETARKIVMAILAGEVPHVRMEF